MTEMTKELHWPELTTEEFIRTGDLDDIPGAATPREVSELIIRLRKAEAALEAANAELAHTKQMLNSALFFNNGGVGKTLAELGLEPGVVESEDTSALNADAERHEGSSPSTGTTE